MKFGPQVELIGVIEGRKWWQRQRFPDRCNFSLILQGDGVYRRYGKEWVVNAPCVITHWGEDIIAYGPNNEWTEVFFRYGKNQLYHFEEAGYLSRDCPVWDIRSFALVEQLLKQLLTLLRTSTDKEHMVDMVDHLCISIIAGSTCNLPAKDLTKMESLIRELKDKVQADPYRGWTIGEMADYVHMSQSTFRRNWQKQTDVTPLQFIIELKLDEARELLLTTDMQVAEIAAKLHFRNYNYFSRLFTKKMGLSPTDYRRRYLSP